MRLSRSVAQMLGAPELMDDALSMTNYGNGTGLCCAAKWS
jgi:hypothetical protein